jgi:hypothetical protein
MYAKRVVGTLPVNGAWIAYDLEIGDWVSPIGTGKHADFEFRGIGVISNRLNYVGTLDLRLPGEGNGILANQMDLVSENELTMPYVAPAEGFSPSWRWKNARITEDKPCSETAFTDESYPARGFIFRVRSVLDARGRIVRALHGKIPGPFIFDPRGEESRGFVNFAYYLNPDGTRNLEFDPRRNLFTDLRVDEQI